MANCFYSEILKSAEKIEFKLLDARQVKKSTWKTTSEGEGEAKSLEYHGG